MFKHLIRIISFVAIVPLTHFGIIALLGIALEFRLNVIFAYWIATILDLVFSPYMITRGYYPNQVEISQMTPDIYVLMLIVLVTCWLLSTLVIRTIWQRFRTFPHATSWLIAVVIIAISLSVLWRLTHLPSPLPNKIRVEIDMNEQMGKFPPHHRGFSQGGEGQMVQEGYFERAMTIMTDIQPDIVRIDHLFDYYNVLQFDDDGNPIYDFSELDRVVNAIIDVGATPLMSLSYAPPTMAQNNVYVPPTDLELWETLVYATVHYYNIERGLNIRYWEVWNEPNLFNFWDGTIQEYLDLYTATAQAIKQADPSALVGGPATFSENYIIPTLYRFNEENWFTALINHTQQNGLPLDFLSWHLYSAISEEYAENIALHERWIAHLDPRPEMLMTEWNYTGGKSVVMGNGESVAYLAQTLSVFADSNLTQAYYFEPIDGGDDWINSWGLIRADGIRKPAYYAYTLFNKLGDIQLSVDSNHPNIGGIATLSDGQAVILIWNNTASDETIEISINDVLGNRINLYGVDSQYGNSYFDEGITDTFIESFVVQLTDSDNVQFELHVPSFGIRLLETSS